MHHLILLTGGLVCALIAAGATLKNIREQRTLINLTSLFLGVAVWGLLGLWNLTAGIPAFIIGIMTWPIVYLMSHRTFEAGLAQVYQPAFFRGKSALDPNEWYVVFPGFQPFWESVSVPVAKVRVGNLTEEGDHEVRFLEGTGNVSFRIDAAPPLLSGNADLLLRFVNAKPTDADLADADARADYIRKRIRALAGKMLEQVAEQVSAYRADAAELQRFANGTQSESKENLVEKLAQAIEDAVGLPAESVTIEITGVKLGVELETNLAKQALNDSIRKKAGELLRAGSVPPPAEYRLELREKQRRDVASHAALPNGSPVSSAGIIKLEREFAGMMSVDEYESLVREDKKTPGSKRVEMIVEYRHKYAAAEAAPEAARQEEARYRAEAAAAEAENAQKDRRALEADPNLIALATRLEEQLDEYQRRYAQALKDAIDQTAADVDTSRTSFSVKGLEGLGRSGHEGLEALRMIGVRGGKP